MLGLAEINIEGTLCGIQTGDFSESSTAVLRRGKRSVAVPSGSIPEFKLTQRFTVKK